MYNNDAINKYQKMQHNVSKTKQIVLLYEGMERFVESAIDAIERKDISDRYKFITKAVAISDGLQNCLDFDQGLDIAKILYNYYTSIYTRLMSVHQTNSKETLKEVLQDITSMKKVWENIDKEYSQNHNQNNNGDVIEDPITDLDV